MFRKCAYEMEKDVNKSFLEKVHPGENNNDLYV